MKHLKKISLATKKNIPDDVKVAFLNDKVKKKLFRKNIEYEEMIAGKVPKTKSNSLLARLWAVLEHFPKTKRQKAIKIINQLEASPALQVNENLELVYNGETSRGTNIIQLIRGEVDTNQQRTLLPGQDLFYHVLLTSPPSSSSNSNGSYVIAPEPIVSKRRHTPSPSKRKRQKVTNLLHRPTFIPSKYSPIKLRSTKKHAAIKESRWKK